MFFSFLATQCAGVFFGAAVYISVGQHPAALAADGVVPARLFTPMYRRAAPMQATLAVIGGISGLITWVIGFAWGWLVGGIVLFLLSDQARHVALSSLYVDGGATLVG